MGPLFVGRVSEFIYCILICGEKYMKWKYMVPNDISMHVSDIA